jgi:prephenate dehydratase
MMRKLLRWLDSRFSQRTVTITRISSRPMTGEDWKHFDAAFAKMDEAFAELRKIHP